MTAQRLPFPRTFFRTAQTREERNTRARERYHAKKRSQRERTGGAVNVRALVYLPPPGFIARALLYQVQGRV